MQPATMSSDDAPALGEELLELPRAAQPGERVSLRTADGQIISLTMPAAPSGSSSSRNADGDGGTQHAAPPDRAAELKTEGNGLYRAGQHELAAKAYAQALRVVERDGGGGDRSAALAHTL